MNITTYKLKKCEYCSREIEKRKTESIRYYYKRKFCSSPCQHKRNTANNTKEINCSFCDKKFRRRNSHIKKHNFCSVSCQHRHKTLINTVLVKCAWCGNEFKKVKSQTHTVKNFCTRKCMGEWQGKFTVGESSYNWQGGVSTINHRIRSAKKSIDWVKKVFKRDNFTCQKCGDKKGGNLNAHHIKHLSKIIKEYNIKDMADILQCKELWNINNGITLCVNCHIKEHKK